MNKRIVYCVLGFHAVVALFAPLLPLVPTDEQNPGAMLQGFSTAHWLGTDALGRDVEPDGGEPARQGHGERKSDIAEADDRDPGIVHGAQIRAVDASVYRRSPPLSKSENHLALLPARVFR